MVRTDDKIVVQGQVDITARDEWRVVQEQTEVKARDRAVQGQADRRD